MGHVDCNAACIHCLYLRHWCLFQDAVGGRSDTVAELKASKFKKQHIYNKDRCCIDLWDNAATDHPEQGDYLQVARVAGKAVDRPCLLLTAA